MAEELFELDVAEFETEMEERQPSESEWTDAPLAAVLSQLDYVAQLQANWNERGAEAPHPASIRAAKGWVKAIYYRVLEAGLPWRIPHVTADEEGAVVLDWTKGVRSLVLYVHPSDCTFIKGWGPDMITEMEDGKLKTASDGLAAFSWLLQG